MFHLLSFYGEDRAAAENFKERMEQWSGVSILVKNYSLVDGREIEDEFLSLGHDKRCGHRKTGAYLQPGSAQSVWMSQISNYAFFEDVWRRISFTHETCMSNN